MKRSGIEVGTPDRHRLTRADLVRQRTDRGVGSDWRLRLAVLGVAFAAAFAASITEAQQLSGTIRYSGSRGPVSASRPIRIVLYANPYLQDDPVDATAVTSSPGSFQLTAPTAGTYYVAYWLDQNNDGEANAGDPGEIYNNRSDVPGDPITVPRSGLGLDFDDSVILATIKGTITYTGSQGPISSIRPLVIIAYTDPGLTELTYEDEMDNNSGRYEIITLDPNPRYLLAFVDVDGNGVRDDNEPFEIYNDRGTPPGDPVVGSTNPGETNLVFGDEHVAPGVRLSGTIRYSGTRGPVSASQPIRLVLHTDPYLEHESISDAVVYTNPGSFELTAPTAGTYYLAYWLDRNNDDNANAGEPAEIYNNRTDVPGDPIAVPQPGVSLDFDDSLTLAAITGSVTYTGNLGPISSSRRLRVQAYTDPGLTELFDQEEFEQNGGRYEIILPDPNPRYLLAFLDLNGNGKPNAGEPFEVYNDRGAPPGDPAVGSTSPSDTNIVFGDEHIRTVTPTATFTPTSTRRPPPTPGPCVGDCDTNGRISIEELVRGVRIALGQPVPSACPSFDEDNNQKVTIDELVRAVNGALYGCVASYSDIAAGR